MDITERFGKNMRKRREHVGVSQEWIAELSGLHRTYIGAVERGERNITLLNAERIAEALETTVSELVAFEKPKKFQLK